jgi:hypothetical protein
MAQMPKLNITFLKKNEEVTREVQIIFADMVRWDVIRKRNDFPSQTEAQSIWMAVLAFAALVRGKELDSSTSVEDFLNDIVMVEPVDEPEAAEFPGKSTD